MTTFPEKPIDAGTAEGRQEFLLKLCQMVNGGKIKVRVEEKANGQLAVGELLPYCTATPHADGNVITITIVGALGSTDIPVPVNDLEPFEVPDMEDACGFYVELRFATVEADVLLEVTARPSQQ